MRSSNICWKTLVGTGCSVQFRPKNNSRQNHLPLTQAWKQAKTAEISSTSCAVTLGLPLHTLEILIIVPVRLFFHWKKSSQYGLISHRTVIKILQCQLMSFSGAGYGIINTTIKRYFCEHSKGTMYLKNPSTIIWYRTIIYFWYISSQYANLTPYDYSDP